MLPSGKLSKHGYNITHGFFNGTCVGSAHLPFEKSCDLVKDFIASAEESLKNLEAFRAKLREEATTPKCWIRAYLSYDEVDTTRSRSRGGYFWMEVELRERLNDTLRLEYDSQYPAKKGHVGTHMIYGYPRPTLNEEATNLNRTYADWLEHEADSLRRYIRWQTERVTTWKEADLFPVTHDDKEGFAPTKPRY